MQWLRLYHDTPNDPKWRLVAVESEQSVANVLAVWMHMMVNASASTDRGTLEDWDDRIVAASLGIKSAAVTAIREAMQGLVLEGDALTGWAKRQRASDNGAERVAKHRKSKQTPPDDDNPGGNGAETDDDGKKPNGRYGNGTVTLQDGDVTLHSEPVTLPPLRATDSRFSDKELDDDDARVREIAAHVSRLTGLEPHELNRDVVKSWLSKGADPERDIIPGVEYTIGHTSQRSIRGFGYFSPMILELRDRRMNPQPERARPRLVSNNSVNAAKPSTARLLRRYGESCTEAEKSGWPS